MRQVDTDAVAVRHLSTQVHGRYLKVESAGKSAGRVLGFHGYGEDAQAHLDALAGTPGIERWTILAVQALHPFYKKNGEIVASWMTRLDRELAIADNVEYVRGILASEGRELPTVTAGFSQGVAMAYRAAVKVIERPLGVIALAGDVPPELSREELASIPRVLIGRGLEDEWYDETKLARDLERLSDAGVAVEVERFPGGHEWGAAFVTATARFLARARGGEGPEEADG